MNLANAKRALLCLILLSSTMGSSSDPSSSDPLSWTNLLGLGSCMEDPPIKVPALPDTEEFAVTGNKRPEAVAGHPVALAYLVNGGYAPYNAQFNFGDGTAVVVPVSLYQSYAATTHTYSAPGYYYGNVIVQDSRTLGASIEFTIHVTAN